MKTYHILNDLTLEAFSAEEDASFPQVRKSLTASNGKVRGNPATFFRNRHGELVYVQVDCMGDLEGYQL